MEIEYQSNGLPRYVGIEDLKEKLGYPSHKPRLGSLGRAILTANKNFRSNKLLRKLCNSYYQNIRHTTKRRLEIVNAVSK